MAVLCAVCFGQTNRPRTDPQDMVYPVNIIEVSRIFPTRARALAARAEKNQVEKERQDQAQQETEDRLQAEQDKKRWEQTTLNSIKFSYIQPGTFLMGSRQGADNEKPVHEVRIPQGFYMQTTEVTQAQWQLVMGTRPWFGEEYVREGDDYPAIYVSWDDVEEFLRKLNQLDPGKGYRLPTEAEWEYVCRAGTNTEYCFGNEETMLGTYAWYDKNAWDIGEKYAHRVAQKQPNAWGMYDMHGNVFEWCNDWYDEKYYHQVKNQTAVDPQGALSGSFRVFRGGSWNLGSGHCRSADRLSYLPDTRNHHLGFRLAAGRFLVEPSQEQRAGN